MWLPLFIILTNNCKGKMNLPCNFRVKRALFRPSFLGAPTSLSQALRAVIVTTMFTTLTETQRAALTILVFFVTFFFTLSIGRLLKRRAGVRLGVFSSCFVSLRPFTPECGLWATDAIAASRHRVAHSDEHRRRGRPHQSLPVGLLLREEQQTPIPHFLREMVALLYFPLALLFVLSFVYHAEAQLKGLLAGSGITAIILGFAGQNLFGGIIAGISLQISRPYKVGDWLQVGERFAEVMEITGVPLVFAPTTLSISTSPTTRSSGKRSSTCIIPPRSTPCASASASNTSIRLIA